MLSPLKSALTKKDGGRVPLIGEHRTRARAAPKFLPEESLQDKQTMERFVDDSHPAAAKLAENSIVRDGFVDHVR